MVSNSKYTKRRRQLKHAKLGKERKRLTRKNGSTPVFPLDPPEGAK